MSSSQYQDYSPFSSMQTAGTHTAGSNPVDTLALLPEDDYPLPSPQQQTHSWRHREEECWHRQRSHMRMVIEDVGRPLTKFTSTQELVMAIRDAIEGHRQAWEEAGVLHRDISLGNILILDEPEGHGRHIGFMHDFDYSNMKADGIDESPPHACILDEEGAYHAQYKERTGTHFFMSLELLRPNSVALQLPYHDLESYYWVLLWVVLRHTECCKQSAGTAGKTVCTEIFKHEAGHVGRSVRIGWIQDKDWLDVKGNAPLTELVTNFSQLLLRQAISKLLESDKVYVTYDAVLNIFDQALAMDGWPEDDWRAYKLIEGDSRLGPVAGPILCDIPLGYPQHVFEGRALRVYSPQVSNAGSLAASIGSRGYHWSVVPSQSGSHPASGSKRLLDATQLSESAEEASRLPKRSKSTMPSPATPSAAAAGGGSRGSGIGSRERRSGDVRPQFSTGTRSSSRIAAKKAAPGSGACT